MSETEPVIINTVLKPIRKYTKNPNKFYGAGAKAKNEAKKSEECEKIVNSEAIQNKENNLS